MICLIDSPSGGKMWFKKKNEISAIHSEEYEQLSKKFVALLENVRELEVKFRILETNIDNLRGNFNAKLKKMRQEEIIEEKEEETKDINNPVILPYDGFRFK